MMAGEAWAIEPILFDFALCQFPKRCWEMLPSKVSSTRNYVQFEWLIEMGSRSCLVLILMVTA